MTESYLVRLVIPRWEQITSFMSKRFEALDMNHHIYVPQEFVLGNFKERKCGFVFDDILYMDSPNELELYQGGIDEGRLEVIRTLSLGDETIEILKREVSAVYDARRDLDKLVDSVTFKLEMLTSLPMEFLEPKR